MTHSGRCAIFRIFILRQKSRTRWPAPSLILDTALVLILFSGLMLAGCSKGYSKKMQLPEDNASSGLSSWAVVTSAYAIARAAPEPSAARNGLVRKGTVFSAGSRMIDGRGLDIGGTWYRFESGDVKGWIHSDELGIYESEDQAREAAGLGAGSKR